MQQIDDQTSNPLPDPECHLKTGFGFVEVAPPDFMRDYAGIHHPGMVI